MDSLTKATVTHFFRARRRETGSMCCVVEDVQMVVDDARGSVHAAAQHLPCSLVSLEIWLGAREMRWNTLINQNSLVPSPPANPLLGVRIHVQASVVRCPHRIRSRHDAAHAKGCPQSHTRGCPDTRSSVLVGHQPWSNACLSPSAQPRCQTQRIRSQIPAIQLTHTDSSEEAQAGRNGDARRRMHVRNLSSQ